MSSRIVIFWLLLSPVSRYCQATSAPKPPSADFTLQGTVVFIYWPLPLCNTFVSCLVPLPPEPPSTFMTQHILLSSRPSYMYLLCLLVLYQVMIPCNVPLLPVLGHTVPVITNFHSCQIFLYQIPPSSSWTSTGPCLRQPPKKTLLGEPIVLHPGKVSEPFQTASHQLCLYRLNISPLLSHCC